MQVSVTCRVRLPKIFASKKPEKKSEVGVICHVSYQFHCCSVGCETLLHWSQHSVPGSLCLSSEIVRELSFLAAVTLLPSYCRFTIGKWYW
jgi:hypothetical protein